MIICRIVKVPFDKETGFLPEEFSVVKFKFLLKIVKLLLNGNLVPIRSFLQPRLFECALPRMRLLRCYPFAFPLNLQSPSDLTALSPP